MAQHDLRAARLKADEPCMIVREDGSLLSGILVDLSNEGFCVETGRGLAPGERVEMRVAGLGQIAGLVRWFDCNRAGGVLEPYTRGACEAP